MKRVILCGACFVAMLGVAVALMMAVGIEICQREKARDWREPLEQ